MSFIKVNRQNAMSLWKAGAITATNVPVISNFLTSTSVNLQPAKDFLNTQNNRNPDGSPITPAIYYPILTNIALKRGFNAIRVFMTLGAYDDTNHHDVINIAKLGWSDTSIRRNLTKNWLIPYYAMLAEQITNILSLCEKLGIGVILCADDCFSSKWGNLWQPVPNGSDDLWQVLISFWGKTAQKWSTSNALIGYELLNEPGPAGGMSYAAAKGTRNDYKALMDQCVAAIRTYDTTVPILVSTPEGASAYTFDYFGTATYSDAQQLNITGFSSTDTSKLITDSANRIVYTFHYYNSARYTHQGLLPSNSADFNQTGTYTSLGLSYPFNAIAEVSARDGKIRSYNYNVALRDLSQTIPIAQAFKTAFPNIPIFLGEFSSISTAQYKVLEANGASKEAPATDAARQIVSMYQYLKNGQPTARIVLQRNIQLFDSNAFDAQGLPLSTNQATVTITPTGATNSPFSGTFTTTLIGNRYKTPGDANSQTGNFYFEFPMSNSTSVYHGLSGAQVEQALANGSEYSVFANAASIGTFKIEFTQAMINAQEASRAEYARDILRMCSKLGFSWAWFGEYTHAPYWGDKYWSINDTDPGPVGDAGKRLRALLKRASSLSVE